jgi:hypothetical protein
MPYLEALTEALTEPRRFSELRGLLYLAVWVGLGLGVTERLI